MTDIEAALGRLRAMPVPPGLAAIDCAVLDGIARRGATPRPLPGSFFGVTAAAALAIGVAGSLLPAAPARIASAAPFGAAPALAPSTLLGAGE